MDKTDRTTTTAEERFRRVDEATRQTVFLGRAYNYQQMAEIFGENVSDARTRILLAQQRVARAVFDEEDRRWPMTDEALTFVERLAERIVALPTAPEPAMAPEPELGWWGQMVEWVSVNVRPPMGSLVEWVKDRVGLPAEGLGPRAAYLVVLALAVSGSSFGVWLLAAERDRSADALAAAVAAERDRSADALAAAVAAERGRSADALAAAVAAERNRLSVLVEGLWGRLRAVTTDKRDLWVRDVSAVTTDSSQGIAGGSVAANEVAKLLAVWEGSGGSNGGKIRK